MFKNTHALFKDERRILMIKDYSNTNFVHIMLDRDVYIRLATVADRIGTTAETVFNNAIVSLLRTIEDLARPSPTAATRKGEI